MSLHQTRAIIFDCEFSGMLANKLFYCPMEINIQKIRQKEDAHLFSMILDLVTFRPCCIFQCLNSKE